MDTHEYKPNPRANHIGPKTSVTPQYPRSSCRKRRRGWVYTKGKSVFKLIDPDGHIYVLQAHDAQFPIESLAKLGEQMKQLPKGWQYRTRALTEDLALDLGPDKTIYAVGDEFHQYYTRIAETK